VLRYASFGVRMKVASSAGLTFLHSELQTGLTLARIALSAKDADKRNRNFLKAREAYDSVLHFMPRVILTVSQSKEIKRKLERLKSELRRR
jgi:hypothetical protein